MRRRSRSHGISPRRSKGKGKQRKGDAGPIGAACVSLTPSSSSRPTTEYNDALVRYEKARSARVQLKELKQLEACIGRAIDAQKRTIDSLNFFTRQMEDERKILTEARNVINELIFKASFST